MAVDPDLSLWLPLLLRARSGSMLSPPVGDEGSAHYQAGDSILKTLLLCDLADPPAALPLFPPMFDAIVELDLSGNGLTSIPANIGVLKNLKCLFLGGGDKPNTLDEGLPSLASLHNLEHLSVHDTALRKLPGLPASLRTLRVDRCPLEEGGFPEELPRGLTTLHLEGCPLPGTLEEPGLLPAAVRQLVFLEDLQLPDGGHMGIFFGTPLAVGDADGQKEK